MMFRSAGAAGLLFVAFALIFASLTYLVFAAYHVSLLALAVVALAGGIALLWFVSGIENRALVHVGAAAAALLFIAFVPRAVTLAVIARAADAVSGGAHCYYQDGGTAYLVVRSSPVLARDVRDLSVSSMLTRRAGTFGPPHVTLITRDWTWLWSFRERRFVQWQRIYRAEGPPIIEGSQFAGRPSVGQVARCLEMITNRGVA